jgi:hypothetical protein
MGAVQYHMCGNCRREFYSDEAYRDHACLKNSKNPNGDPRGMHAKAMANGMFKDITGDDKKSKEVMESISAGNGNVDANILESQASTDIRLQAVQEMKRMKHELTKAGIPCNTLSEEQTRAEYEQYVSGGKDAVSANKATKWNATATNTKPSAATGKRGRKAK